MPYRAAISGLLSTSTLATQPTSAAEDFLAVFVTSISVAWDNDTNPVDFHISAGVSAKGLIPNRDNDTMGIAYSYNSVQDTRLGAIIGIDDSSTLW